MRVRLFGELQVDIILTADAGSAEPEASCSTLARPRPRTARLGTGRFGTGRPRTAGTWLPARRPALLETKLYVPKSRRGLVARPRLSERLDRGAAAKLTLVSAPAGFGKTTLLAEWLAAGQAGGRVGRVALARPGRQRPRLLLDLRHRRAADGGAGSRRERALAAASVRSRRPIESILTDAAQRAQRRHRDRHRAGARRLPRHRRARRSTTAWPSCSSTSRRSCTW